jgi:hypothetical protein
MVRVLDAELRVLPDVRQPDDQRQLLALNSFASPKYFLLDLLIFLGSLRAWNGERSQAMQSGRCHYGIALLFTTRSVLNIGVGVTFSDPV